MAGRFWNGMPLVDVYSVAARGAPGNSTAHRTPMCPSGERMNGTWQPLVLALSGLLAPVAPAPQDVEARVHAQLESQDFEEALSSLVAARSAHPRDQRWAYLRAVVLERQAIASTGVDTTEIDFLTGRLRDVGPELGPSTAAFVEFLTDSTEDRSHTAVRGTGVPTSATMPWCTDAEERYPDAVHTIMAHTRLMRWGPLNLRSGEIAVPGDLETLRRYAVARLATHAQYLDRAAKAELAADLVDAGVEHAALRLDLCFANVRSSAYWGALGAAPSEEDWLFISAAIGSLATGLRADSIVSIHNRLVDDYPLLAREVVGWADVRKTEYDESELRTPTPSGPLKVRILEEGGAFIADANYEVVRASSEARDVLQHGTTAHDGSFVVPRETLSQPCLVRVDGYPAGRVSAADHILTQLSIPKLAGSLAPDCELSDLDGNRATSLSDLRGKVVYIDFWATWCAPCQEPMAELEHLAEHQSDDWRDRVALLGVSIDEDKAKLEAHLRRKNWTSVEHFWAGPDIEKVTGPLRVTGVPTAFLLDPDGQIVWTGHPSEIDLEEAIAEQLEAASSERDR